MVMIPFRRRGDRYALIVGMTGVKMGDRIAQIACAHSGRMAAVARKVGLTGRFVVIAMDAATAARAQSGALEAGALVEVETGAPDRLPLEDESVDLVLIDDTGGWLTNLRPESQVTSTRESLRVLRPGGRVMVIGSVPRAGLAAILSRAQSGPPFDPTALLQADGFRSVRTLAEREGLIFFEGMKPRSM
jgi:ubiquinone/menaquinone biosynthesis C-methylase UbiE